VFIWQNDFPFLISSPSFHSKTCNSETEISFSGLFLIKNLILITDYLKSNTINASLTSYIRLINNTGHKFAVYKVNEKLLHFYKIY